MQPYPSCGPLGREATLTCIEGAEPTESRFFSWREGNGKEMVSVAMPLRVLVGSQLARGSGRLACQSTLPTLAQYFPDATPWKS